MTLAVAQQHLDAWLAADLALATSKEYRIGSSSGYRTLTRADAAEVARQIAYWSKEVARLEAGRSSGVRMRRVIMRDV